MPMEYPHRQGLHLVTFLAVESHVKEPVDTSTTLTYGALGVLPLTSMVTLANK